MTGATSATATIAAIAAVGSAGLGAVGAIEQGKAASASAGYNAEVAANNAKIATQNASLAGAQGEQQVAKAGAETRAKVGATLTAQGASGIDVGSGSAVDIRESESKLGMLSALNVRSQAAQQAYGYQTQSAAFTGQQGLDVSQQKSAQTAGDITAGADILGGIGKASQFTSFMSGGDPTAGITGSNYYAGSTANAQFGTDPQA